MRTLLLSITFACSAAFSSMGQGAGTPPEGLPTNPPAKGYEEPLPLMPQTPALVPLQRAPRTPSPRSAAVLPSKTQASIDNVTVGIRIHQAKAIALVDPEVEQKWAWAHAARTAEGQRERLMDYYRLLYAKMVRIDRTLKQPTAALFQAYKNEIEQHNIQKSEMIERR